jgi:hypothetical protein
MAWMTETHRARPGHLGVIYGTVTERVPAPSGVIDRNK